MGDVNMHSRLLTRKEEKTKRALPKYCGSHGRIIAVLAPESLQEIKEIKQEIKGQVSHLTPSQEIKGQVSHLTPSYLSYMLSPIQIIGGEDGKAFTH